MKTKYLTPVLAAIGLALLSGCSDNRLLDLVIGDSNDGSETTTSTETHEENTESKNDNSQKGAE